MSNGLDRGMRRTVGAGDPQHVNHSVTTIATAMDFGEPPEEVWPRLIFFEQIKQPMPILLRHLLPRPIGVEGAKRIVGDSAICRYDRGHLVKRITRVEPPRFYEFDVIEQSMDLGGNICLLGGGYQLIPIEGGGTRVALTTRYTGGYRPRWLARRFEALVCHAFHRFVLRSLRTARADEDARRADSEAA